MTQVTVQEASKRTRIPVSTLYRYIRECRIHANLHNGRIAVYLEEVKALYEPKVCAECGKKFRSRFSRQKYHSKSCEQRRNAREWYRRKRKR
jgi:hypothetical protein